MGGSVWLGLSSCKQDNQRFIAICCEVTSKVVGWIIGLAPFGIMGLVFDTIANNGLTALKTMVYCSYSWLEACFCRACCQSLNCFSCNEENPYPLVFECLRVSGVTAFLQEVQQLIFLSICSSANV